MIGTNNTGNQKDPPEKTAKGIKAILEELKKRTPKTKVLLLAIFLRGKTAEDPDRKVNDKVNAMIAKYADNKRVFFLDIGDEFLDKDGNLPNDISGDKIHLTEKGYEVWAQAMEPTVKKLME